MSSGFIPDHDASQVLDAIERGTMGIVGTTHKTSMVTEDPVLVTLESDTLNYYRTLRAREVPTTIAMRMAWDYAERNASIEYTVTTLDADDTPRPVRIACKSNYNGTRRKLPVHPQHP